MPSVQQYLISARFFTTMGHFVALLILFNTIENNVEVSLGDDRSQDARRNALATSWVCIFLELYVE